MLERQREGIATAQRDGKCRCQAPTVQRRAAEIGFSCSRLFTTTSGLAGGTATMPEPSLMIPGIINSCIFSEQGKLVFRATPLQS
jgi:hypothetical protein